MKYSKVYTEDREKRGRGLVCSQ